MSNKMDVNERIRAYKVRVIDEKGEQRGVMDFRVAMEYARSLGLDLVKVAEANPPVVKVVDAGKYMYELQKQQKALAKKQRAAQVDIKEVQLRPVTDTNDLKIKAKRARSFLDEGDKVKVVMRFRGRENSHKDVGRELINQFLQEVGEVKIDSQLSETGNQLLMVLAPAPAKAPVKQ